MLYRGCVGSIFPTENQKVFFCGCEGSGGVLGLGFGFWNFGFGVFGLTICEVLGFCLSDFLVLAFVRLVGYSFGCFQIMFLRSMF